MVLRVSLVYLPSGMLSKAEMKKEIQKFESALSKGPSFDSAFLILTECSAMVCLN
jgi:hypothetical protein